MDGDPVEGEPSEPLTLGEFFTRLCPSYMVMGMTYDEFWHRNTACHKAFREAYEIRKRNQEWERWRQGAYFYDALLRVAPVMRAAFGKGKVEPGKYPDEPWPLTEKEAKERLEREARERYYKMRAKLMAEAKAAREKKEASEDGGD